MAPIARSAVVSLLSCVCAAVLAACAGPAPPPESVDVLIGGEEFVLELAADATSRTKGLMGRTEIDPRGGMLFVFPDSAVRRFWMKDCLVDIDVAFLDAGGRVTAVHTMRTEPLRAPGEDMAAYESRLKGYSSVHPAQFAVELAAGSFARLGVGFEDKIALELRALKALAR